MINIKNSKRWDIFVVGGLIDDIFSSLTKQIFAMLARVLLVQTHWVPPGNNDMFNIQREKCSTCKFKLRTFIKANW